MKRVLFAIFSLFATAGLCAAQDFSQREADMAAHLSDWAVHLSAEATRLSDQTAQLSALADFLSGHSENLSARELALAALEESSGRDIPSAINITIYNNIGPEGIVPGAPASAASEVRAGNPLPEWQAVAPPPSGQAASLQVAPPAAAPPPALPLIESVVIIPGLPDPHGGGIYRIQVGAYSGAGSAEVSVSLVEAAGFRASRELSDGFIRVFVEGIPAAAVQTTVLRLAAMGFSHLWIRG
ncbi:MAG: hypothetical protein FWE09_04995 [Treponema sp.]|nr:hypothetical protein [Treponema sp.]